MSTKTSQFDIMPDNHNMPAPNLPAMDFIMESCPYCGGSTEKDEFGRVYCQKCG